MIPHRLYMRNFMCYREQSLDLRGIGLACLTGDNGHGKSAVLDAMTWALWGYSRLGARRDDELIHLGQTEMEVEFEFGLGAQVYRVLRKRDGRKRGSTSLELQGWDVSAQRFRPLTEPTSTKTQQAIITLLRMDYDTFINSAFLLQGRADEFTVKPAGERKRVLGSILGLDIYAEYEQAARQTVRDKKARADQLVAAVEQIDHELAREGEYKAAAKAAETELARLKDEREAVEKCYEQARADLQEAELAQQQLADLERRIQQAQIEIDRLDGDRATHQARLDALQDALAHADAIAQGFADYEQAIAQNEALNARLGEMVALRDRRSALEGTFVQARHALDGQRIIATEQVRQLEQTASALDHEPEWDALRVELTRLDEKETERTQAQQDLQTLGAQIATLQTENKQAEQDAEQIKGKIALLEASAAADQAVCPLCGQPLAADGCARLTTSLHADLEQKREEYRSRNIQINLATQQAKAVQERIKASEQTLRGRAALQRKEAALAHIIEEARAAQSDLERVQTELERIETQLKANAFAQDVQADLAQVEAELAELGYDADAHGRVKAEIERLRSFQAQMQTLQEARSSIDTVQLAMKQLDAQRIEIQQRIDADQVQAGPLAPITARLPELREKAIKAQQSLEAAHNQEQDANLRLGAARSKVDYCADLHRQRARRREEEKSLRQEQGIYQELQEAFGKNGVQAMLIETAIPDIEEEANRLLARMTARQMQVRFETQRDTKKGDTIETLDIHIADALGTRSYETYSGGERYRVNFAIRIALSKLLARRAGARLEMLVIDEGFGTQDAQGRDGILAAINAVSNDFGCILVITHIDELKDAFSTRIEVKKGGEGSEITIV
ncbi:MAG: SMC family ATPase [Anaerolineae bacterium]|nr:SMC family ATPase [Anaerolineae bacterium]